MEINLNWDREKQQTQILTNTFPVRTQMVLPFLYFLQ